jgi:hypothetical protein
MALPAPLRRRPVVIVLLLVVLAGLGVGLGLYFWWSNRLPRRGSPEYTAYVEDFQVGVAALDVGGPPPGMNAPKQDDAFQDLARAKLTKAIDTIPGEPAGLANRGLWFLRNNRLPEAKKDLEQAEKLAPDNPEIQKLLSLLDERNGKYDEAAKRLRDVLAKRPDDLPAIYALTQLIEKYEAKGTNAEDLMRWLDEGLKRRPTNLRLLREKAKVAAQQGDRKKLQEVVGAYQHLAPAWSGTGSNDAQRSLEKLAGEANGPLPGEVPFTINSLDSTLAGETTYLRDVQEVGADTQKEGEPVQQFLRLDPMRATPSPADRDLEFEAAAPPGAVAEAVANARWDVALPVWLTQDAPPAVFVANAKEVRRTTGNAPALPFPGKATAPSAHGVLAVDWYNDFRTGLVLAGAGGLRFFRQDKDGKFTDVTADTGLDKAILDGDYYGAWAADIEMDGDLDIILAPRAGPPVVLRNNGNGTFKVINPFPGVEDVRDFAWADFDNDGAPDAAFLDAQGRVHVFANERFGQFRKRTVPGDLGKSLALVAADVNDDGVFDLVVLRDDGVVRRLSDKDKGKDWEKVADLARWEHFPNGQKAGTFQLLAADLDNNGSIDLLATGPAGAQVWLSDVTDTGEVKFAPQGSPLAERVFAAVELTQPGRLDLLAVSGAGQPVKRSNRGKKDYHWQDIRPSARNRREEDVPVSGRVNSFGIGSEVEVRSGLVVQKQLVGAPVVHFGLGEQPRVAVARFLWTNGGAQAEFEDKVGKPDQSVSVLQRLYGSCPFLFTDDGRGMQFVTDFMWSTPLGMYVNGHAGAGFAQTEEWVKIRGDQLVPRDGRYHVRATADLWETHFFDHLSLIVVDHPADTDIWADERFALAPTAPSLHVTAPPRPVARAWDDQGRDVTEVVRAVDGKYLDSFGRGRFQGVTRDHWVEVDLGDDAPAEGPVWLLASGWIRPTDSSLNVAIEQGAHDRPRPLVLEVPDGHEGWKVARDDIGFPAGKNKTILIRLDGLGGNPGVARRFRLRTNMEIYWDALRYAKGLGASAARQQRLAPEVAELRYRGISLMTQADDSSPELPQYERVSKSQCWRDLIGYYTRYGDVRELLAKADDRYVIMNAGDEIALTFRAPDGPPPGWRRDFIWVSDGWTKDGNLNTRFSKSVLPLPYHAQEDYDKPPGRLEDDPVYQRFPDDWKKYHTRYVTPAAFEQGLRNFRRPR